MEYSCGGELGVIEGEGSNVGIPSEGDATDGLIVGKFVDGRLFEGMEGARVIAEIGVEGLKPRGDDERIEGNVDTIREEGKGLGDRV